MTGNLSASNSSCTIGAGNSTCSIPFSWSTQNPEATSSITRNGLTVASGNNGNQNFSISKGSQTFYLYNNSKLLDTESVSASCASGTTWNGSLCEAVVVNTCTINNFTANPTSIVSGQSSVLNWSTSDCVNVVISNLGYNVPNSGSQAVYPTNTKTYTLTAYGQTGAAQTRSVTVYVNQPSVCNINNFTASRTSIIKGEVSTLSWDTSDCTSVNISSIGVVSTSGSKSVYPTNTKTYTLTAYGANNIVQTKNVTVYVNESSTCQINNFTASRTYITKGQSSVLNWSTSDCVNVVISNLGYNVPNSGSQAVYPTNTKTYTLTAYGNNGMSDTQSVSVYVDEEEDEDQCEINSFTASDTSIDEGDYTILKWNTTNCDRVKISDIGNVDDDGSEKVYPDEDTTYVLTAYDDDGSTVTDTVRIYVDEDNDNNDDECSIDSFTANKIYINSGDAVTLKWRTTDCDDVDISGVDNNMDEDGSETIYPTSTRTYTLRASGDEGSDSRSLNINVNYNPIVPPVYNTNVVTTVATNISQTGAQLNGLVTSTNYTNANVYFEYGRTVTLGSRTSVRTTSGNSNFSDYITGLSPNTIYYFQAVSEGSNGISRGSVAIFRTLAYTPVTPVTPVKPIVIQGPTVTSASPIVLRIENRYQTIGIGETVDYTVYYKNISNSKLTNPMVQVFIPKGITLINASRGTYSESDRTLSAPIEDLLPGGEGVIYLQGVVDSLDANLAQIVTTAILIYTNPNGAQENAMAYVLNNPKIINLLGASAFFGGFLGMSLIGWLFLILLILLIILIARSFYNNRRSDTIIHNHPN